MHVCSDLGQCHRGNGVWYIVVPIDSGAKLTKAAQSHCQVTRISIMSYSIICYQQLYYLYIIPEGANILGTSRYASLFIMYN